MMILSKRLTLQNVQVPSTHAIDAARAIKLMKLGYFHFVSSFQTNIFIATVYKLFSS